MNTDAALDAEVQQLAVLILAFGGPTALEPFQEISRFERMAQEFEYAIRHTSSADMASLLRYLASDTGSALLRRATGLVDLAGKLAVGTVNELSGMIQAYSNSNFTAHLGHRVGTASAITSRALSNGASNFSSLARDLVRNPTEAAPKLLVLVLSSVAASGGLDGNGGLPDLDIPLMGIGAHRSPFTHSILIGSLLETALLLLTRFVRCTHKNLPANHDPLWDGIARQSEGILIAAGKGASIGIAYHLMVDAVVQPGAYHGMPFDMPLEAHQTILATNSVAEGVAAKTYPDEVSITASPEILASHKKYRAIRMSIPGALREFLQDVDFSTLTKYGAWLQALAKRDISPTTVAQVKFLKVADGLIAPETEHEKAWSALTIAKRRAGWVTNA